MCLSWIDPTCLLQVNWKTLLGAVGLRGLCELVRRPSTEQIIASLQEWRDLLLHVSLGLICGPICLPCSLVQSTKYSRLGGEFCVFSLFWWLSFSPRKDFIMHRILRGRYFLLLLKIVFTWTLTSNFFVSQIEWIYTLFWCLNEKQKTFTSSSGV